MRDRLPQLPLFPRTWMRLETDCPMCGRAIAGKALQRASERPSSAAARAKRNLKRRIERHACFAPAPRETTS